MKMFPKELLCICFVGISVAPPPPRSPRVNHLLNGLNLNEYNGMLTSEEIDLPVLAQLSALAQHAPQSNGYLRFMLFDNVYLQTYFVFESKSTCTTFKWLFLVCAPFQCESSNLFRF